MKPLIIAHRGASAYEPENTIRSFKKAIAMKADFIELDVRKSKDNKIIVMHDPMLNRVTNNKGLIKDFTLNQLKQFKVKGTEEIPTLEEVIKAVKGKIRIVIEIKVYDIEKQVLNIIKKNNIENQVIIASFKKRVIKNIRSLDKNIQAALIIRLFPIVRSAVRLLPYQVYLAKRYKANWLMLFFKDINKGLIKKAHEKNIKVGAWTIDKPSLIKKFKEINVDAIVSNKPNLVKKFYSKAHKPELKR